jgi:hypothetical protein
MTNHRLKEIGENALQVLIIGSLAFFCAVRIRRVIASHAPPLTVAVTIGLVGLAAWLVIDTYRRKEHLAFWPWRWPARQWFVSGVSVILVFVVDVPGIYSFYGEQAKSHILEREQLHIMNQSADINDSITVARGDDLIGSLIRFPRIPGDLDSALSADAASCTSALITLANDERGFEDQALLFSRADDATAHARCAFLQGDRRLARSWIGEATRRTLINSPLNASIPGAVPITERRIARGIGDVDDAKLFDAQIPRHTGSAHS